MESAFCSWDVISLVSYTIEHDLISAGKLIIGSSVVLSFKCKFLSFVSCTTIFDNWNYSIYCCEFSLFDCGFEYTWWPNWIVPILSMWSRSMMLDGEGYGGGGSGGGSGGCELLTYSCSIWNGLFIFIEYVFTLFNDLIDYEFTPYPNYILHTFSI